MKYAVPVIVCPCISRFDLLERMIESINYPVERLVIVDNSCTGWESSVATSLVESIEYIRPILNLGYPGGLNAGISQTPEAPWWVFCNADITFSGAGLERTVALMRTRQPRFVTSHNAAYAFGALNRNAISQVGLFDEWSFYPAYFDDNDWDYRRHLAGVERIDEDLGVVHGDEEGGSLTIRSDERYRKANDHSFIVNKERYIAKWGGLPGEETFTSPWNTGLRVWYTVPDLDSWRDKQW